MNKELFVSSTPHETKVGLVEDDLLAEIYLERENEYTLAGSIYKGRVTRVLPGMQSAFVDVGLERDAFLYVSDFMELEEHDEDLTDSVPASRGVQDLRPQAPRADAGQGTAETADVAGPQAILEGDTEEGTFEADNLADAQPQTAEAGAGEPASGNDSQNRERGSWRGRRRRRGGRRDGRGEGRDRAPERGGERGPERSPERSLETSSPRTPEQRFTRTADAFRPSESSRTQPSGPPPGYQPILLPGESISKYQRYAQPAPPPARHAEPMPAAHELPAEPLAATFPEDEPVFASGHAPSGAITEPLHEEHDDPGHEERLQEDIGTSVEDRAESVSTSAEWSAKFQRRDSGTAAAPAWAREAAGDQPAVEFNTVEEVQESVEKVGEEEHSAPEPPVFAAPGTMVEETIDEDEADTVRYESSSDEGYDEFEEETHAAGPDHLNGEAREAVSQIHSEAAAGEGQAAPGAPAEGEEDSEELELEEAQAEAEAMLEAEARGNGTVDARAEVRAPAATAGYTQRAPRPAWERGRGQRGRRGSNSGGRSGGGRFRRRESAPVPLISDLLKEGQEILVQIAKEPIGKKGARITSHIALPGRFLVYMPTVNHTGVSRKIASEEERQRLKRIIQSERENGHGGFIVRTAAQNASEDELRADIRFLKGLWNEIKTRAENSKPPALIYHDLNVVERVLRDQVTSDFNVIWVDTEPEYERILRFFNRFQPGMVKRVKLYTKETPLFEQFGLAEEMNKALKSKVWLKSGGYIVINQTEALVAIDINTGKYVGKTQRLEDTIVKTNIDAIKEIVRQIRLRDLGGIIIIDFIDMDERRNRQRVMQALEEELRHDRAPSKTLQFNDFGLVAITRKRVKQSLERTIGAPCPYCQSTGYVKSVTTVCNEIYVEMRKIAKHLEHEDVMLRVNPDVAKELKSGNAKLLNEMEEMTKRTIIVKSDPALHQEQFDIN
jgi:Rne/Rng family ribonuclease